MPKTTLNFHKALKAAEERLSSIFDKPLKIKLYHRTDKTLLEIMEKIDHQLFRSELWYDREEVFTRSKMPGFTLLLVTLEEKPQALIYGYEDLNDPREFHLDSVATTIEGKGIGTILITLILGYCYESGYKGIRLFTEERDEKGRHLRQFYEKIGFKYIKNSAEEGIWMEFKLDADKLSEIFKNTFQSPLNKTRFDKR